MAIATQQLSRSYLSGLRADAVILCEASRDLRFRADAMCAASREMRAAAARRFERQLAAVAGRAGDAAGSATV